MYRPSTPKENSEGAKGKILRRKTGLTPSSRFSAGSNEFTRDALQIFNEVQANRQRILKKDSDSAFYTKTTVKTLKFDANGKEVIEKFEATSFGGVNQDGEKVGEVSQKYSNESTGLGKWGLQRIIGNKVRRIEVKKTFDCEFTNEFSENCDLQFDNDWKEKAKNLGARKVMAFDTKVKSLVA